MAIDYLWESGSLTQKTKFIACLEIGDKSFYA